MAKKEKESSVMVWSDKSGTYKLGYSQYLQKEMLKTDRLLLIAVLILIAMLIIGGIYAWTLVQKIDALNVISKMATGFLVH